MQLDIDVVNVEVLKKQLLGDDNLTYSIKIKANSHAVIYTKGQIISKGHLVSSNSPKKRTNEFILTILLQRICSFGFWENSRTLKVLSK